MSNPEPHSIEVPPFDALLGNSTPFQGFGQPLACSSEIEAQFRYEASVVLERFQHGFGLNIRNQSEIPAELDKIVATMWATGWNPGSGNVNLFTRDFGIILAVTLLDVLGGQPIFRTEKDVNHFSIYWEHAKIEAFPFHKTLKCLYNRDGETMASFTSGITVKIGKKI